jgi:glycine/D-amino acid oxidase-like deaminating enzyme
MTVNGNVSYWFSELGLPTPRDVLDGNASADVVIVGAGYTGLWTAYYLAQARPDLTIRMLDQHFAGYGASGRNGGWLINTITGGQDGYARLAGRDAAAAFQLAMNDTVDEVIRVAAAEGIEADIHKGGSMLVARNRAQLARLEQLGAHAARWPEEGLRLLDAGQADARIRIAGSLGGAWLPHCARIHPAKLVTGLARTVRALGVTIHEGTRVTEISSGRVTTERGVVTAPHIVRATEGFTSALAGEKRTWVPLNSSMIVTEPLPKEAWDEIGWNDFDTLEDLSHVYSYAQRTADGRIAIGGRGNPYRFGSKTDNDGQVHHQTIESLTRILHEWFPAAAKTPIAHGWSGVLGVPRDWRATVGYDRASGVGWAGGYVGTGVAATNLAGRTMADLVLGVESELTRLPWVNRKARKWEPEPLRWIATHAIYRAYGWADRLENRGGSRTSGIARIADVISGRD